MCLLNKCLRSIAPLFQAGVAFLQESGGADTQENEVAITVIVDLLRHPLWNGDNVASRNSCWRVLADRHEACTALDDVPFGYGQ